MGRIIVTNNLCWGNKLKGLYDLFFKPSYVMENEEIYAASYFKLKINNKNYFSDGNKYIIAVGTLIYKNVFGEEALKEILLDSETKSIKEIRKSIIGSYAIALKNSKKYFIFADETHTYFLYYFFDGNNFLFSNSCWHIAHVIGSEINEYPLLEMGVRRCIMSNRTPYKNVNKLSATEYFEFDLNKKTAKIKKTELNNYKPNFSNKEEASAYITEKIKDLSQIRSRHIKSVLHFLTGGIDSRLELSINAYNNDRIKLGYWMGDDLITNGTKEDANIVSDIGNDLGFPYTIFDVKEDFKTALDNINRDSCIRFGEYASIYGGNSKWFNIFDSISDVDSVGFGYLGEMMRPLGELDNSYKEPFTSIDYIKNVYCRCGLEKEMFQLENFYPFLQNELHSLIEFNNGDENNLSKDLAFKLFSYSRFEADCLLNNFSNLFVYSFPILGSKIIADAILSIKYDWVLDDYISIRIIESLYPKLLEYPIYSHHRSFIYKKESSKMIESLKYRTLDNMKTIFEDTFIYKIIYLKFAHKYIRPQSVKNDEIMKECAKTLQRTRVLDDTDFIIGDICKWKGGDIGSIATFIGDLLVMSQNDLKNNNLQNY